MLGIPICFQGLGDATIGIIFRITRLGNALGKRNRLVEKEHLNLQNLETGWRRRTIKCPKHHIESNHHQLQPLLKSTLFLLVG